MARTEFDGWPCSVARTVDILGDAWSVLILREVFYGVRRFAEIQATLGVSRNVLTRRLRDLVGAGVLKRCAYQDNPPRHDYVPTPKGRALFDVLMAMMRFGDEWLSSEGAPIELRERETGRLVRPRVVDTDTGQPIDYRTLRARTGPGFPQERLEEPAIVSRFGPPEGVGPDPAR